MERMSAASLRFLSMNAKVKVNDKARTKVVWLKVEISSVNLYPKDLVPLPVRKGNISKYVDQISFAIQKLFKM